MISALPLRAWSRRTTSLASSRLGITRYLRLRLEGDLEPEAPHVRGVVVEEDDEGSPLTRSHFLGGGVQAGAHRTGGRGALEREEFLGRRSEEHTSELQSRQY